MHNYDVDDMYKITKELDNISNGSGGFGINGRLTPGSVSRILDWIKSTLGDTYFTHNNDNGAWFESRAVAVGENCASEERGLTHNTTCHLD